MKDAPASEAEAVSQYRAFVIKTARGFRTHVPEEDLIQEGMLAVALAFRSWKKEGGSNFLTWIRQPVYFAMLKRVEEGKRGGLRGLQGRKEPVGKLSHWSMDATPDGHEPDDTEDGLSSLHDLIGEFEEPEDTFALERLPRLLSLLRPREREILRMRFTSGLTLEQVARQLGLTHEYVRQLEARSLKRLKALLSSRESE